MSKTKLTTDQFIKRATSIHGDRFTYNKTIYVDSNTKVIITCRKHGDFEQKTHNHLNGAICNKCGYENRVKTKISTLLKDSSVYDKFPKLCKEWSSKNTTNPQDYTYNSHKKVLWHCFKCNHEYNKAIARRTIFCLGCPECDKATSRKVMPEINESLLDFHPEICEEWSDKNASGPEAYRQFSNKRVFWTCKDCSYEWETRILARTKGGTGCPRCRVSHGEKAVEKWLKNNSIEYRGQHKINGCKGEKRTLPFDFAIWVDGQLKLIEFNGKQHYIPHPIWNKKENNFEMIQKTDRIKQDFCEENNIPLLVIPYTDLKKVEEILQKFVNGA